MRSSPEVSASAVPSLGRREFLQSAALVALSTAFHGRFSTAMEPESAEEVPYLPDEKFRLLREYESSIESNPILDSFLALDETLRDPALGLGKKRAAMRFHEQDGLELLSHINPIPESVERLISGERSLGRKIISHECRTFLQNRLSLETSIRLPPRVPEGEVRGDVLLAYIEKYSGILFALDGPVRKMAEALTLLIVRETEKAKEKDPTVTSNLMWRVFGEFLNASQLNVDRLLGWGAKEAWDSRHGISLAPHESGQRLLHKEENGTLIMTRPDVPKSPRTHIPMQDMYEHMECRKANRKALGMR